MLTITIIIILLELSPFLISSYECFICFYIKYYSPSWSPSTNPRLHLLTFISSYSFLPCVLATPTAQSSLDRLSSPITTFRPPLTAFFQILQALCQDGSSSGNHLRPHHLFWDSLFNSNTELDALILFPWQLVPICTSVDLVQLYC